MVNIKLTSILILAGVAVAVAIPDVDSEFFGLVVAEWPHTLVPASLYGVRDGHVRLLLVASALVTIALVALASSVALVLVAILLLSVAVFLIHYFLVVVGFGRRVGTLIA